MIDFQEPAEEAAEAYAVTNRLGLDLCYRGSNGTEFSSLEIKLFREEKVIGEFVLTENGFVIKDSKEEYLEAPSHLMGLNGEYENRARNM